MPDAKCQRATAQSTAQPQPLLYHRPMANVADVLVVGLGAVGSAALYQSAKLGARVIGIDRFVPPHDQGSSHGDTRITRQAIGEGRDFVPLVLRSNQIWEELEAATGRSLMVRNGGLVLASANTPGSHHGSTSFVQDTIDAAIEFGIAHEVLSAEEIGIAIRSFVCAAMRSATSNPAPDFFVPKPASRRNSTRATTRRADLHLRDRSGHQVTGRRRSRGTNRPGTSYSAGHVIVTAGRLDSRSCWATTRALFQGLSPDAVLVCRWRTVPSATRREHFPVFIWITGNQPRDMMYGFPAVDGPHGGVKIATEQYEATVDPDAVPRGADAIRHRRALPRVHRAAISGCFGRMPAQHHLPLHGDA